MKIREGAYYRTRGGDVVGPMKRKTYMSHDDQCPFFFWDLVYHPQGQYREGFEPKYDLISEVYVSDTPPADALKTEAELREMMRDPRYWQKRDPEWVKRVTDGFRALVGGDTPPASAQAPETKTLRDEFAMEAMKLLIPRQEHKDETFAELAYIQADAMMEARKK